MVADADDHEQQAPHRVSRDESGRSFAGSHRSGQKVRLFFFFFRNGSYSFNPLRANVIGDPHSMATTEAPKQDNLFGLGGLWDGIAKAADDAKKAAEGGLKNVPGLPASQMTKDQIKDAFKEFDKDKNGILDVKELQDFAFSLGETWSDDTCKKVMEQLDTDKSGGLDIEEFSAWFLTPGNAAQISAGDDMFTKMALGPQLFARHAQRKATEVRCSNHIQYLSF